MAMLFHNSLRLFALTIFMMSLNGCAAIPIVVQQGSWFASGISYITTRKGPSDHALSIVVNKDCSLFRVLKLEPICRRKEEIIDPYDELLAKDVSDYF